MRRFFAIGLITLMALVLAGCWGGGDKPVYSGTVESTLLPVNAEISGKVVELLVEEGQEVKEGDVLARLDDQGAKIALAGAEAQLKQAQARLADLLGGSRAEEIRRLQAGVAQAQALEEGARQSMEQEEKNLRDMEALLQAGAISQREYDAQATKHANVKAQYESAAAAVKAAQSALDLAVAGATGAAIDAQRAAVETAQANVDNAKLNVEKTVIKSPIAGRIIHKHVEAGQILNPGSRLFTVADPRDLWVKVFVPEAKLNEATQGRPCAVAVDAYPERSFAGEIVHVAEQAEFTPKNVQTKEERTTLVFRVKVKINEGFAELKPGMPADVTFN